MVGKARRPKEERTCLLPARNDEAEILARQFQLLLLLFGHGDLNTCQILDFFARVDLSPCSDRGLMFRDHVAVGRGDLERAIRHVDVDISPEMSLELLLVPFILHNGHVFAQPRQLQQLLHCFGGLLFPNGVSSNAIGYVLLVHAS